jgi:hypothetical protein
MLLLGAEINSEIESAARNRIGVADAAERDKLPEPR